MNFTESVREYLTARKDEALSLLCTLAQIPSPSNHEEKRAEFCRDLLVSYGAEGVYIDDALNVVYPVGDCTGKVTVFMAHSDVVFPDTDPLPLKIEDGMIKCPGVGDDTANAVALLMTARYIAENRLAPKRGGILLVINSGEEGLGNLKGVKKIMADYSGRVTSLVSYDSAAARAVNKAVGSRRFRIGIDTEGGHSYNAFGNRNAIACLASMIDTLYKQTLPSEGKTTFNVGTVSGGTSVNTIAQHAEMLYEFRSDERTSLAIMQKNLDAVLADFRASGLDITVECVGERPCGKDVDEKALAALMDKTASIYERHYGTPLAWVSGSTDCNIPLSLGIPAVTIGCCLGKGAHTREEYVLIDSLLPGLCVSAELVLGEME